MLKFRLTHTLHEAVEQALDIEAELRAMPMEALFISASLFQDFIGKAIPNGGELFKVVITQDNVDVEGPEWAFHAYQEELAFGLDMSLTAALTYIEERLEDDGITSV